MYTYLKYDTVLSMAHLTVMLSMAHLTVSYDVHSRCIVLLLLIFFVSTVKIMGHVNILGHRKGSPTQRRDP